MEIPYILENNLPPRYFNYFSLMNKAHNSFDRMLFDIV